MIIEIMKILKVNKKRKESTLIISTTAPAPPVTLPVLKAS
jgi:hypothetical protein